MIGNVLVAQSGGPTSVINASLVGVVKKAKELGVRRVLGGLNGIEGILQEKLVDLSIEHPADLDAVQYRPGAVLGGCRYQIKDPDPDGPELQQVFSIFQKYQVRYFFYIGGNDSMDTAQKIHTGAQKLNIDLKVIGVPKTIDNDLFGTDHCPGFGSCAKYLITSVVEAGIHTASMYTAEPVTILVTVGRNAGWLAGACGLARREKNEAPHIVLFPEIPFEEKRFLEKVKSVYEQVGGVFIVTGEGLRNKEGTYITARYDGLSTDAFGHPLLGDVPITLKHLIEENLHLRTRWIKPDICQQAAVHMASRVDLEEARLCGEKAVQLAIQEGESGYMVTIERVGSGAGGVSYASRCGKVPLSAVANVDRYVPRNFIDTEGFFPSEEFLQYVKPLIQGEVPIRMKDGFPYYPNLQLKHVRYSE
ncbi:MAG: 6-phosphofructokinase [Spirochaetes bacterium]|nr:6-phosphofructokinase [Spirochaetota bacterium]